jgi:hypothetical protein
MNKDRKIKLSYYYYNFLEKCPCKRKAVLYVKPYLVIKESLTMVITSKDGLYLCSQTLPAYCLKKVPLHL